MIKINFDKIINKQLSAIIKMQYKTKKPIIKAQ